MFVDIDYHRSIHCLIPLFHTYFIILLYDVLLFAIIYSCCSILVNVVILQPPKSKIEGLKGPPGGAAAASASTAPTASTALAVAPAAGGASATASAGSGPVGANNPGGKAATVATPAVTFKPSSPSSSQVKLLQQFCPLWRFSHRAMSEAKVS